MALFKNTADKSHLLAVEFSPVSDGNFTFFYADNHAGKESLRKWLSDMGQSIVAETPVEGNHVFVTHGNKTQQDLMKELEAKGDHFLLVPKQESFDTWKAIALLAVPGQALQLSSSLMRGKKDWGLFTFSAANLLGHVIGWVYGSQKSPDEHRTQFIKAQINTHLQDHVADPSKLPDINLDTSTRREEIKPPASAWQKASNFLQEYSVSVGEIGLRYLGGIALVLPTDRWKRGFKSLGNGGLSGAWHATKNPAPLILATGLGSLTGKTIALSAKAPDPYNPEPPSALDTFRTKVAFRLGGNIEAASFGIMAYNSFFNQKIKWRGKEHTDYLGGIGASLFTIRYIVRNWAKFGERQVDMDELNAHMVDGLAKTPPEKLPQLMADTAADLVDHFKDKHLRYGEVYADLMNNLYRYHHISLDNLGTEPEERMGMAKATAVPAKKQKALLERVQAPYVSHAEQAKSQEPTALVR